VISLETSYNFLAPLTDPRTNLSTYGAGFLSFFAMTRLYPTPYLFFKKRELPVH